MSNIHKKRINIFAYILLWVCQCAVVWGQQVPDTIPFSGHKDVTLSMGTIVPTTDNSGYCLTNNDGTITIHPSNGCRVHLEGTFIITKIAFNEDAVFNDSITIFDGTSTASPVLKNVTGADYLNVYSSGPMTIQFKSNAMFQASPFTLHYTCVASCACENEYPFDFVWSNDTLHINWVASFYPNFNNYSIEYGIDGFRAGQGTSIHGIDTNHFALTNLQTGTKYDFRITYHCNGNNASIVDSYTIPIDENCTDMRNLLSPNIVCTRGGVGYENAPYRDVLTPEDIITSFQHNVVSQQSFDPYTNNGLPTIPDGVTYSIKLGNTKPGESESISYTFTVDTNTANIILLKYAAIMEQPGHESSNQPRFDLQIIDENQQIIDSTCGQAQFIASSDLDWHLFQYRTAKNIVNNHPEYFEHQVLWKDWTDVGLNITQYHGQTITIRLTTRDCGHSQHFGYGYFHIGCLKQGLMIEKCGNTDTNTFIAPTGFKYNWYYDDEPDSRIGDEQSITLPIDTNRSLSCFVESIENSSCGFWLHCDLRSVLPKADFDIERIGCSHEYSFTNSSHLSNITGTNYSPVYEEAKWDFGDGETSTHYNATHAYAHPGTYTVKLISSMNFDECSDTLIKTILVPIDTTEFTISRCDSYTWNGQTYTSSGDYVQTFPRPDQTCDSVAILHLTIFPSYQHQDTLSICPCKLPLRYGDRWFPAGTITGTYPVSFQTTHGCDSLVMLHLIVNPITYAEFIVDTCDTYTWINGITYTESNHTDTIIRTNQFGCDSIVTLNLNIRKSTSSIDSVITCDSLTWINGVTYYQNVHGEEYHLTNAAGCDSLITLELTVNHSYDTTVIIHVCRSELPTTINGIIIPQSAHSGRQIINNTTTHSCDSTVRIELFVHEDAHAHVDEYLTDNNLPFYYQEQDTTFLPGTHSGSYIFTRETSFGCDSIIELHLTIELAGEIYGDSNHVCNGYSTAPISCNGYAYVNVHGGLPPYQYQWDDPMRQTTDTAHHLCEGDYLVHVTDALGANIDLSFHVSNVIPDTSFVFDTIGSIQIPHYYHGHTFNQPVRDKLLTIQNENGCDSIIHYNLYILENSSSNFDTTVCAESLPFRWYNIEFEHAGALTDSLILEDSTYLIRTFHISTYPTKSTIIKDTTCHGIIWNGIQCAASGTYVAHLTDINGCDSTVTLELVVNTPQYANIYDTICRTNLPYNFNGRDIYDTLYTETLPIASNGCDSIITLHLTLKEATPSHVSDTIGIRDLNHYSFNGHAIHQTVTDTLIIIENQAHCDSLIYFSLYLYPNTTDSLDTVVCPGFSSVPWHEHLFQNASESFIDTTYNENGSYHFTHYFVKEYPFIHSRLRNPIPNICSADTLFITIGTSTTHDIQFNYETNSFGNLAFDSIGISGNGAIYQGNSTYAFHVGNLQNDATNSYNLFIQSDKGCRYDTTFDIRFVTQKRTNLVDTICKEELPYIIQQDTIRTIGIHHTREKIYQGANGCDSIVTQDIIVLDFKNPITHLNIPDVCAGDTAYLLVGYGSDASISLSTEEIIHSTCDTIFLPDSIECPPYGNEYISEQTFTEFTPNATIRSADDILYLRLKMEHSAAEDLEIKIVCPDSSTCTILPRGIEDSIPHNQYFRINFGVARRDIDNLDCNPALNPIGIPWNYVWSCNTNQGYTYANSAHHYCYENVHYSYNPLWDNGNRSYKIDSSDVTNMRNIYRPAQDFSNLIGCPLNGNWSINVRDWLAEDNGYLTEWELGLSSDLYRLPEYTIEQRFLNGIWVQKMTDSTFRLTPPGTLVNDTTIHYQLTLTNTLGCSFDTTITIHYNAKRYSDTTVIDCDHFEWNNVHYQSSGDYEFTTTSSTGCDSTARLHLTINPGVRTTIQEYICQGNEYDGNGFHITQTQTAGIIKDSIRLTTSQGCDSTVTLTLTIVPTPALTICNDTIIHAGGIVNLSASGADAYEWSPAGTLSSTISPNPTATPSQSMYYHVNGYNRLQDLITCEATDSVQVLIYRNIDTTICINGLPITWHGITFHDTLPQTTVISNPNGFDDAVVMHIHFFIQHETIDIDTINQNQLPVHYNGKTFLNTITDSLFVLTDHNGCDSLVHFSLVINWNKDTTIERYICQNDLPFIWHRINYDTALYESTILTDSLLTSIGTDSTVTLNLIVHPAYDTTIEDQVCEKESYDNYGFHISAQETRYRDTITLVQEKVSALGCDSIIRLKLAINKADPVITSLIGDFCAESFEVLSVDDIYTDYVWNTGETSPSIEIRTPGYYSITVTNGNCSGSTYYDIPTCEWNLYLPNAITPSKGDGLNDFFQLDERAQGMIDEEKFNIRIFNRYGELIFYSKDKHFRWNGEYKGKKFYNNVYVYKINCYDINGEFHTITGTITVL